MTNTKPAWADMDTQLAALSAPIDPKSVRKRKGAWCRHGNDTSCPKCLSYIDGLYVREALDAIFGPHRWGHVIKRLERAENASQRHIDYLAVVELYVVFADGTRVTHEDVGYGNEMVSEDRFNGGARPTVELAIKEAVTDGIKRCAINLGNVMGRSLYDKHNPIHRGEQDSHGVVPPDPYRDAGDRLLSAGKSGFIKRADIAAFFHEVSGGEHPLSNLGDRHPTTSDYRQGVLLLSPEELVKLGSWLDKQTSNLANRALDYTE